MNRLLLIFLFSACYGSNGLAALSTPQTLEGPVRANQLKSFIESEKSQYQRREAQRRDLLEELDRLNADQNAVRRNISDIQTHQQEVAMALENMAMEVENQKRLEELESRKVRLLLKVVHKIQRDGVLRFVVKGSNLSALAGRVRIVYRTLREQGTLAQQLRVRAQRLQANQATLSSAQQDSERLLAELNEQEDLLKTLLARKERILVTIRDKQTAYHAAVKSFRQTSKQVSALFENFESAHDPHAGLFPARRSLPIPIETGRLTKKFGKQIHEKFKTVTYNKGVEIEAEHGAPVHAVLPGTVEFEGWVKGLGNVIILHHGEGFYSLSAHLFRTPLAKGTAVQQGEIIGFVGDTGESDRPSLYFEIRENGRAVDPFTYFSSKSVQSLSDRG